jgi:hypothetical protein
MLPGVFKVLGMQVSKPDAMLVNLNGFKTDPSLLRDIIQVSSIFLPAALEEDMSLTVIPSTVIRMS